MATLSTRRLVAAAAGAATGVAATVVAPAAPALAANRGLIVQKARAELGHPDHRREIGRANCNFYTGYWTRTTGAGCASGYNSRSWCADFAKFVWMKAEVPANGELGAHSDTFVAYGQRHGTWHGQGATKGIQPGDAVIYDDGNTTGTDHVGIVVSVDGGIRVVSGNMSDSVREHGLHDRPGYIGFVSPL